MDLHFTAAEPSAEERAAVDRCLAELGVAAAGGAAAPAPQDEPVPQATAAPQAAPVHQAASVPAPAGELRQYLLPVLHAVQGRVGWISPGALNHACRRLEVPPAEAFGVADFYALFQTRPHPPLAVHVCDDIACQVRGAGALCAEMEALLGPPGGGRHGAHGDSGSRGDGGNGGAAHVGGHAGAGGDSRRGGAVESGDASGKVAREADGRGNGAGGNHRIAWHRSPCLGQCERAPAALVFAAGDPPREHAVAPATSAGILSVLEGGVPDPREQALAPSTTAGVSGALASGGAPGTPAGRGADVALSVPQAGQPGLKLLARVGRIDPESLDDYRAAGGFLALRRALEMGPEAVLREVVESKLVGRGGAAFPTGQKWQGARAAPEPRYLICNADESEPGTFKDRVLLERDPFALVEAMAVAGFATGCERGYIYIRGEYPLATERLANAIRRCRERGFLGRDVLGAAVRFDVELRRGAGAYICGEETALMNSLEGRRGEPRNKPPFPTQAGLFGRPTVINNVETLVNVLPIVVEGGRAFAAVGTERSTGTKLFCLSGHVRQPGVYEAPFGITLEEVLELAGGIGGNGRLQAVLLGGAAGGFVTPDQLDVPLTFEGTRAAGATLGSAVVLPFDDSVDLRRVLLRIARFFRDESCGQCVPCRVGTVRQEELLHRLAEGRPLGAVKDELALLEELGQVMRDASICGLGQTASSAVESALARFPLYQEAR